MRKNFYQFSVTLVSLLIISGCASTTLIETNPPGAKIYINGKLKGETPFQHSDEDIIFTSKAVKITKDGYQDLYTTISRSEQPEVGPIIGGFFFPPIWLWSFGYDPVRMYELEPVMLEEGFDNNLPAVQTKAEKLRDLKQLLDEGILTKEEYEKEKKKILDE